MTTTMDRMRKPSKAIVPLIAVDRRSGRPLHRQIYDAYRDAILRGELRGGQQVPSSRLLAQELGVSRIPVLSAYEELLGEGYFETRTGAGTFVSTSIPDELIRTEARAPRDSTPRGGARAVSKRALDIGFNESAAWIKGRGAFSIAHLAFDQFPLRVWSRLVARRARMLRSSSLGYPSTAGREDLRQALATYLGSARGVRCDPNQIMIVGGSQQALLTAALALLDPGDRVWMEDPAYWLARRVFQLCGAEMIPVPVDNEGLDVAHGMKAAPNAKLAFVTPSHQFPLGVTMSLSRRLQLLEWANSSGGWIIEDDYDSEFRYESRPLASLQGLDPAGRVIYVGTFSKVLFPSMRTGYMVVPLDLVDRFRAVRQTIDVSAPDFNQAVLADFIEEGHFARHIRRMRMLYGERREALEQSIDRIFDGELELLGTRSGLHLTVALPPKISDVKVSKRAEASSLWLWPLSIAYLGPAARQGFMLCYSGVAAREMPKAVRLLQQVLYAR